MACRFRLQNHGGDGTPDLYLIMTDSELNELLKRSRLPERPETYWEDFPRQVELQLGRKPAPRVRDGVSWFPRLAWGFALVALCLAIGFFAGRHRGQTEAANDLLQNPKFLQEVLAQFPHRVRAVIKDANGLNLILSDADDVPSSAPLWVKVCNGKDCSVAVTFSGQEIELAGQKITVLSNSRGEVLLVGDRFAWPETGWTSARNSLKIETKNLGALAM
jgi:hypothetical protein